jgi:DNA topoisomerase-2
MHAEARLAAYAKRKAHDLAHLAAELELLDARARFVGMAVRDELPLLRGAPTQMLLDALRSAGFKPGLGATSLADLPNLGGLGATSLAGGSGEGGGGGGEGGGEDGGEGNVAPTSRAYDYLLRLPLLSLTEERVTKLMGEIERKRAQATELQHTSELALWSRELEALRMPLQAHLEAVASHATPAAAESRADASSPKKSTRARRRTGKT